MQGATVRKLYSVVRQDLKIAWGVTSSFQLFINGTNRLVKNNSKMNTVGLYNGITLHVVAESQPYSWDLFVKLPGRSTPTAVTLYEVLAIV